MVKQKLALSLLGAPLLELEGVPVHVDTRKAIALLAYLAITRQPHSRDTLAALLWPEYSQTNARAALRRTISALHRSLGEPLLESRQELLHLPDSSGLWVDAWEFHRCLAECESHPHPTSQACPQCLPWLANAAGLYRDTFLAGFSLRDSTGFDDWQFFESETLRRELGSVLERLVQGYTDQGNFETAIDYAQRWLSLDALHEPAHRQLMQLYALSGQRNAALRQYQECVRILDKELGVLPLEETSLLFREIKEQAGTWQAISTLKKPSHFPQAANDRHFQAEIKPYSSKTATQTSSRKAHTLLLPLTNRESEWKVMQQTYAEIEQDGKLIVLEGEAGIGKTRLAEEFLASIRPRGISIIQARCYPGETNLAYAPFIEGLSSAINQPVHANWHQSLPALSLSETARLLPAIQLLRANLPAALPATEPGAQARFFESLCQVIRAVCAGDTPGVLFLDDIQWADDASLDLLTYFVRRLRGHPLLVLLTWRGEDLVSGHRLHRMLAETQRDGSGKLLSPSRLTPESIQELVGALATQTNQITPALAKRLYEETEGLPFFIFEYLASFPEVKDASAPTGWPLPHGMRNLLHSRLEQISGTGIQLLQTAAAIGRSFDFDTLREASGRSDEETIQTLENLIDHGLIRETLTGLEMTNPDNLRLLSYDFSHEKLRQLVYGETSLARKRLLHLRIAESLVGHSRGRRDQTGFAGQIAHHYKQAGQPRQAAEFYQIAGEQARSLYANADALAHFQAALALGHPEIAQVNEAISDMHTLLGNYDAAIHSLEAALAQQSANPTAIARLGHKLGDVYHRLGEWQRAEGCFQASAEALRTKRDPAALAHLYADWSRTVYRRGDMDTAWQMASQALSLAFEAANNASLALTHNILGILSRARGDLPAAIDHLDKSLTLAKEIDQPGKQIAPLNNLSLTFAEMGDLNKAIELAGKALELCANLGDRHREAALHNNLADLYHAAGLEEESMAHLKQAVVIFAEVNSSGAGEPGLSTSEPANRPHPEIWKLTEW
jgi:DNA-binding SARP family transcriptional activator/lipopolysaccharide biosynthesis regulator YciM